MKKLAISRITADESVSYSTRGLDNILEREQSIQADCIVFVETVFSEIGKNKQSERIAKAVLSISAAVHSDIERILRQHGKKSEEVET